MSATDSTYINDNGDLTKRVAKIEGTRVSAPDKLSSQVIVEDADGNKQLADKVDANITIDEIPGLRSVLDSLGIADADLQKQITENLAAIKTEQQQRANGDSTLQKNLNTEISERKTTDAALQTAINTEQGRITAEISRATSAESALEAAKINKDTVPSTLTAAKLAATASSVAVDFTKTDTNTGTGTKTSVVMPVASSEQMGMMSKETFATVVENASRLAALEGAAKRYPVYLPTQDVTQAQYQQSWENASGKPTGTTPADGDTLVNLNNNHAITYYVNAPAGQEHWIDRGVDTINPATNDVAGTVKGDAATPGKVFVEPDSSMSVVGWDDMVQHTQDTERHITAEERNKLNEATTIGKELSEHTSDAIAHITNTERTTWNNKQNKDSALNYNNITNCTTEIPQDIKLELNNGTLILKAGSKVYVPNGVGVFDTVTIANDITFTMTWGTNSKRLFFLRRYGNDWGLDEREVSFSGGTAPTNHEYSLWYDTTNNLIKKTSDYGSTWESGISFPIALITNTNNITTSIDHVFNGFGYIGSTVFALPGLKGLAPNGRNPDGSLKNNIVSVSSVVTRQIENYDAYVLLDNTGVHLYGDTVTFYREKENRLYDTYADGYVPTDRFIIGHMKQSSSRITSFAPKTAFHAVDYNDTEYIAHQAMPSDRYVDLTLGGSGASYTAPADGWFFLHKAGDNAGQFLTVINRGQISFDKFQHIGYDTFGGMQLTCLMPVKKGDVVHIGYSLGGQTYTFRFIYAQGAQ